MNMLEIPILMLIYADPGSGALLLQMLMAALFGALFYFRSFRDRVFGLFRKRSAEQVENKDSEEKEVSTADKPKERT